MSSLRPDDVGEYFRLRTRLNGAIMVVPVLPQVPLENRSSVRWFSSHGCVVHTDDCVSVYVGGSLIGSYSPQDRGARNVILVGLAGDPRAHLGKLAKAFDVASETLRLIRHQADSEGLEAVVGRSPGGSESKVSAGLRKKLEKMFAEGVSVTAAHKSVCKRHKVSRSTVGAVRAKWGLVAEKQVEAPSTHQPSLPQGETALGSDEEKNGAKAIVEQRDPIGAPMVQHAGTWLMMASVAGIGVHAAAEELRGTSVDQGTLRIAIDAVVASLSLGQRCVEGVRRLATPTAAGLLRADHAPSASWVRRVLGRFARDNAGLLLHLAVAGGLIREAQSTDGATVFYVDNHMRMYTGAQVVRRGWRMQDKCVRPGSTDYYVHDERGLPLVRLEAPEHRPLTDVLRPVAELLRTALGDEERILLAFDRAGAFPEQMVELRDLGVEFVTYERRPYPLLAQTAFDRELDLGDEQVSFVESRTNLRRGRGRVQRIAVRHADGRQVNLLGVSQEPADRLIRIMAGRWVQENAFKHGNQRWGINQLDSRAVVSYPADSIVPNPVRRRLDRALRVARVREGDARNELARLAQDHPRHGKLQAELADALALQKDLLAQRPSVPTHARLDATELRDVLVKHESAYKATLDTLRIACANAEADLAADLAPLLPKPREAKRVLANVLAAPGRVRIGCRTIAVELQPAGTQRELAAIRTWLADLIPRTLSLPADPLRRRLRFRSP